MPGTAAPARPPPTRGAGSLGAAGPAVKGCLWLLRAVCAEGSPEMPGGDGAQPEQVYVLGAALRLPWGEDRRVVCTQL